MIVVRIVVLVVLFFASGGCVAGPRCPLDGDTATPRAACAGERPVPRTGPTKRPFVAWVLGPPALVADAVVLPLELLAESPYVLTRTVLAWEFGVSRDDLPRPRTPVGLVPHAVVRD